MVAYKTRCVSLNLPIKQDGRETRETEIFLNSRLESLESQGAEILSIVFTGETVTWRMGAKSSQVLVFYKIASDMVIDSHSLWEVSND